MIGILAYGSLVTKPGHEIESGLDHVITDVHTPFPVEYARRSWTSRAGAPILVPIPDGCGEPVKAAILVFCSGTTSQQALDVLYRREINQVGNKKRSYDDRAQRSRRGAVVIGCVKNFHGLSEVYYSSLAPNFSEIIEVQCALEEKAAFLAQAAIDSVQQGIYENHKDGIYYLADNINLGVITALTEVYRNAVLEKAGNAPDLQAARQFIARQRRIIS